ncbi:MAG: GAF domain-containing protein, partial [Cytophagia bacterium]|nr:GAF domain-containing protein [Cytophagia bacterium]
MEIMNSDTSVTRKTLLNISTRIGSTLNTEEVTVLLAGGLSILIEYDIMAIYEADHEQEVFRPLIIKGHKVDDSNRNWSIPFGKGILGSVISSSRGENVKDAHTDSRTIYPEGVVVTQEQMIAIPLQIGNHCWGALMLNRLSDKPFDNEEFETAQFLASYASLALNNTTLIKKLREKEQSQTTVLKAIPDSIFRIRQKDNHLFVISKSG